MVSLTETQTRLLCEMIQIAAEVNNTTACSGGDFFDYVYEKSKYVGELWNQLSRTHAAPFYYVWSLATPVQHAEKLRYMASALLLGFVKWPKI